MVRILAIADEEDKGLWDYYSPEKTEGIDLIISCGDLSPEYLEFLVTMTNKTVLYVRGNHDTKYDRKPPKGCIPIDDRIYDFRGLRIMGLGGSYRYHDGKDMYTETEMARRISKMNLRLSIMNGFDLLVTHAPASGWGDMEDLPHRGFNCFNELLERWKPKYMFHGHVHKSYGNDFCSELMHSSGTKIFNCWKSRVIEIGPDEHPKRGKTGSPLFDLYVSVTGGKNVYGKREKNPDIY